MTNWVCVGAYGPTHTQFALYFYTRLSRYTFLSIPKQARVLRLVTRLGTLTLPLNLNVNRFAIDICHNLCELWHFYCQAIARDIPSKSHLPTLFLVQLPPHNFSLNLCGSLLIESQPGCKRPKDPNETR
jgi:hypothetical protein